MTYAADEERNCRELEKWLAPGFETWREVTLRHVLFRRRRLRIDVLAVPREEPYRQIALGFEVKGEKAWDTPTMAKFLKQATDYVLGTVEPGVAPPEHNGKHVMAVFTYPEIPFKYEGHSGAGWCDGEVYGMRHLASYLRVGSIITVKGRRPYRALYLGEELWSPNRGWRGNARNVLIGKRQIGSQKFPILEELEAMKNR